MYVYYNVVIYLYISFAVDLVYGSLAISYSLLYYYILMYHIANHSYNNKVYAIIKYLRVYTE